MPTPLRLPYRGPEGVERIRSGDEAAFEALFHAFAPGLCGLATRYVGERAIAEELAVTSMAEERSRDHRVISERRTDCS